MGLLLKIKLRQFLIWAGLLKPTLQDAIDRIIISKELER